MENIPIDAVGIISDDNDDPLKYRNSQSEGALFDIVVNNDNSATAIPLTQAVHGVATYLSAILSRDRQKTYWVNETKPLP